MERRILVILEQLKEDVRQNNILLQNISRASGSASDGRKSELPQGLELPLQSLDDVNWMEDRLEDAQFRKGVVSDINYIVTYISSCFL